MAKSSQYVTKNASITVPWMVIENAINEFVTTELGTFKYDIEDIDLNNKADSYICVTLR